jgi:hypothetical protein
MWLTSSFKNPVLIYINVDEFGKDLDDTLFVENPEPEIEKEDPVPTDEELKAILEDKELDKEIPKPVAENEVKTPEKIDVRKARSVISYGSQSERDMSDISDFEEHKSPPRQNKERSCTSQDWDSEAGYEAADQANTSFDGCSEITYQER